MNSKRIHKAPVLLANFFAICMMFASVSIVKAQKLVVFDELIIYQGYSIDNGDIISITSVETGADGVSGSAISTKDELMEINLTGNPDYNLLANYNNLNITFSNDSRDFCISTSVEFVVNETTSNADTLHISSCNFVNQYFMYDQYSVCKGKLLVNPKTNIPLQSIDIKTTSGIAFDENWNILPYLSTVGTHEIIIESEYCIGYGLDTIYMDITSATTSAISGNFSTCMTKENPEFDILDYNVFSINTLEQVGEISQSGEYLVQLKDNSCAAISPVNIELAEAADINIVHEKLCDKAVLSVQTNGTSISSYNWWTGSTSETENIVKSGKVWLEVVDENNCLAYDTTEIEFYPFVVESVDYSIVDATCFEDGIIDITKVTVDDHFTMESYIVKNGITNTIVDDFNSVPEGVYEVEATAMNGCVTSSNVDMTVLQTCLKDYPAFTPDGDGIEDEYFIPYEGEIKIYNRAGMLMISLTTPVYWDGRDDLGKILPMGNYVMITDKGKAINITIVR